MIPITSSNNQSINIRLAKKSDIDAIQKLNSKYLITHLTDAQKQNGFIRIEYDREDLLQIIVNKEIVIATNEEEIIGYYLVGRKSNKTTLDYQRKKALTLFDTHAIPFDKIGYGCQVCLDEHYRSFGLSKAMMVELKKLLVEKYDYLLSTISADNKVSLQNSTKIGWQLIDEFEKPTFYLYKI